MLQDLAAKVEELEELVNALIIRATGYNTGEESLYKESNSKLIEISKKLHLLNNLKNTRYLIALCKKGH